MAHNEIVRANQNETRRRYNLRAKDVEAKRYLTFKKKTQYNGFDFYPKTRYLIVSDDIEKAYLERHHAIIERDANKLLIDRPHLVTLETKGKK